MKKILAAFLLLSAQLTFANILESQEASQIVRAIKDSLHVKDLTCYESVKKVTVAASRLNLDLLNDRKVEINAGSQPVIKFLLIEDDFESTFFVTTNEDYTVVTAMRSESYNVSKKIVEVNTGNIINPHYEKKTEVKRQLFENIECK